MSLNFLMSWHEWQRQLCMCEEACKHIFYKRLGEGEVSVPPSFAKIWLQHLEDDPLPLCEPSYRSNHIPLALLCRPSLESQTFVGQFSKPQHPIFPFSVSPPAITLNCGFPYTASPITTPPLPNFHTTSLSNNAIPILSIIVYLYLLYSFGISGCWINTCQ